jgi:hypothetical protein
LVVEGGGGGFSIWEAVGARDWRIEYVRCILESDVVNQGRKNKLVLRVIEQVAGRK